MDKIKIIFNKLNLNYVKEITLIAVSNFLTLGLGISLYVIYKSINYIILMFIVFVFLNLIITYRYLLIKNKNITNSLNEISDAFMYFYLDINNQITPIDALNNMKSHCSINLSDNIALLLDEIKKDKSSSPFIKFAKKYPSIIVESLVFSIYQLINDYSIGNIVNYNNCYKEYKNKIENIHSKNYKKQFGFITLTPVIGTMIITILVVISTILLVRGYING